MRFILPSSRSLKYTGSQTVKTCGAEKCSFTVTLAVAADGTKLPPKMIFKRCPDSERPRRSEWNCHCLPRTFNHEQSLLVWDSFRIHLTDVKAALKHRENQCCSHPWWADPCLAAARQMLEQAIQRQHQKEVLGMDD